LKALRSFFTGLLTEIKAEKIEEYKTARLALSKTHATVSRELACLSKLLRKAVEWHYLKINPMTPVKLLKEPPGRLRYLEPEEIDTLYSALEDLAPWLKPIVQVALLTGMRRNEILTLSWNHVTLRDAIVTLPQTKNNHLRVVPLSREARDIFAAVLRHVSHEFVFVNAGIGRPWDPF
jgi:integrase